MSGDAHVQKLERRWRSSGDTTDERRLLEARVRRGDLDEAALSFMEPVWRGDVERKWLDLLAYAGDPLAVAIVDPEPLVELTCSSGEFGGVHVVLDDYPSWDDLRNWALSLEHWGPVGMIAVSTGFVAWRARVALADIERLVEEALAVADSHYEAENDYLVDTIEEALDSSRRLPSLSEYLDRAPALPASGGHEFDELAYVTDQVLEGAFVVDPNWWPFDEAWGAPGQALTGMRGFLRFHFGFS